MCLRLRQSVSHSGKKSADSDPPFERSGVLYFLVKRKKSKKKKEKYRIPVVVPSNHPHNLSTLPQPAQAACRSFNVQSNKRSLPTLDDDVSLEQLKSVFPWRILEAALKNQRFIFKLQTTSQLWKKSSAINNNCHLLRQLSPLLLYSASDKGSCNPLGY